MMSEWNHLFTKFIGRFGVLHFIELRLISFMDLRLMFFYADRFIGRTIFILRRCSELFELWFIWRTVIVLHRCPDFLDHWTYRFCITSVFRIIRALVHLAYRYCTTSLFQIICVSSMKGAVRFSRSGKFAPSYIGPFSITERIGSMAYRLLLPAQLFVIHDVFHVSQLRKCLRDSDFYS
jgi:hypothetical protein